MRLSDNLSSFMYKQALSEEEVAQLVAAVQEAEEDKKKKKKKDGGPNYGKRFLRGAAVGVPYGGLMGGAVGASAAVDTKRRYGGSPISPLKAGLMSALPGALLGGLGGGLGNLLSAYLQGDIYDAIEANKK